VAISVFIYLFLCCLGSFVCCAVTLTTHYGTQLLPQHLRVKLRCLL